MAAPSAEGLRATALIAYGLYVLALFSGVTAIVGVVLAYVKRDEARGTIWQSHFSNLIAVFWTGAIVAALLVALVVPSVFGFMTTLVRHQRQPAFMQVGWMIALVPIIAGLSLIFLVWFLYRVVRGLMHALDGKTY